MGAYRLRVQFGSSTSASSPQTTLSSTPPPSSGRSPGPPVTDSVVTPSLLATLGLVANALSHSAESYSNFVTAGYQRYLGRTPDAGGLSGWVNAMQNGLTDEQLEAGFIGSAEYIQSHGGSGDAWVRGMYQDLLGRAPLQAEVDAWVLNLAQGMSATQVAHGFAASAEREGQRVSADYQEFLGRTPAPSEVAGWVKAFQGGVSNEDVSAGFVGSVEYFQDQQNDIAAWLLKAYVELLDRPADPVGFDAWLKVLANG
jgi:Domain of unknown function (DUF4214)